MKNKKLIIRGMAFVGVCLVVMTVRVHGQEYTTMLEAPEAETAPFVANEQMPRLIGGTEAITSKLRYPRLAELAQMHGRVIIEFTVDGEGTVTDVNPLKSVKWLGPEVVEVIETLRFAPARQNGRPVPVTMHLPLTFVIQGLTD